MKAILLLALLIPLMAGHAESYLDRFESLAKAEEWEEIIAEGTIALEQAKKEGHLQDEAKICAQLTSSAFYLGDYAQALIYAKLCHELAEEFIDPTLYIRALYLESAICRAFTDFTKAVELVEGAIQIYADKRLDNANLQGKLYFNLGAAHADNPKGDLIEAEKCYSKALECFTTPDDLIRTRIRLGKVYLLEQKIDLAQQAIGAVRPQITTERLAMHADYLEAQIQLALNNIETATQFGKTGLIRAKALGAKEDELRFTSLLEKIAKMFDAHPPLP